MSATIYDWYKVFNLTEFNALGLVSNTYEFQFSGHGLATILVTKGNTVGLTYNNVFLPIEFLGDNPFAFDGFAVFLDAETQDVYLGIEVPE